MSVIEDHPGLRDTWAETHSNTPCGPPPKHATCGRCPHIRNHRRFARQHIRGGKAVGRLRHTIRPLPIHSLLSFRTPVLEPTQSDVVFMGRVPGKTYSFSDHFRVEATFSIRLAEGQPGDVDKGPNIEVPGPGPNTITETRPAGAKFDASQQVAAVPSLQSNSPPGLSKALTTTLITPAIIWYEFECHLILPMRVGP